MKIHSPHDPALDQLCSQLNQHADQLRGVDCWPGKQLELCGQYGVFEWFIDSSLGGQGWSDEDLVRGYLKLSKACLTTTFVITQRTGACQRIAAADNPWIQQRCLPALLDGRAFATVGISHLTTSRRHLGQPVLSARESDGGFILDGYSPWVTGVPFAETVVVGATLADNREVLIALPTDLPGISIPPTPQLVALSASRTGRLNCDQVHVEGRFLLAGPVAQVMQQGVGARTGGLQTSTLALGLSDAAILFMESETESRSDLAAPTEALRNEWTDTQQILLQLAAGQPSCTHQELRTRANSLVLRSTQSALAAAKGAGYVANHPVGRWCQEALFFLVWSCPQPVASANLCELAGLD